MTADALAVNGGEPVRSEPMPPRALFGEAEKEAAARLFGEAARSGSAFGYNGPEEQAFETEFANAMGGGFADGVNSGTNAVFAALGALQLPAGSEVVVPPITDPGGAMPVAMLNCIPVFADADPRTYNMGPAQFEAALTPDTKAAVIAHIGGEPVDMDPILDMARARGIRIVEDCAQAHGALYKGRRVGTLGDIAAFSTMSGKHFATAAQGGVVFTRDETLHWNGRRFADRGKPFNLPDAGGNVMAGLNCNLNELAAAVGRVQLEKLPETVRRRRAVGEGVKAGLAGVAGVAVGWQPPESECSYWFLRITLEPERFSVDKATFCAALSAEGIPVSASYRHIPAEAPWVTERADGWSPWLFTDRMAPPPVCDGAIAATDRNFNIGMHENYGEREIADIVAALGKVAGAFGKD